MPDQLAAMLLVVGAVILGLIALFVGLAFWPVLLLAGVGFLVAGPLGACILGAVGLLLMFR